VIRHTKLRPRRYFAGFLFISFFASTPKGRLPPPISSERSFLMSASFLGRAGLYFPCGQAMWQARSRAADLGLSSTIPLWARMMFRTIYALPADSHVAEAFPFYRTSRGQESRFPSPTAICRGLFPSSTALRSGCDFFPLLLGCSLIVKDVRFLPLSDAADHPPSWVDDGDLSVWVVPGMFFLCNCASGEPEIAALDCLSWNDQLLLPATPGSPSIFSGYERKFAPHVGDRLPLPPYESAIFSSFLPALLPLSLPKGWAGGTSAVGSVLFFPAAGGQAFGRIISLRLSYTVRQAFATLAALKRLRRFLVFFSVLTSVQPLRLSAVRQSRFPSFFAASSHHARQEEALAIPPFQANQRRLSPSPL